MVFWTLPMATMAAAGISAGASGAGAALNFSQAEKQAGANWLMNLYQLDEQRKNREMQKEFAQKGIMWRVHDASRVGIHPLYALGGSGATYTPQATSIMPQQGFSSGAGDALANMGQDISRAVRATAPADENNKRMIALNLEKAQLENELLRSQINRININTAGNPPGLPSAVNPNPPTQSPTNPAFNVEPVKIPATWPGQASIEAGAVPGTKMMAVPGGGYQPVPSQHGIEDPDIGSPSAWPWYAREHVFPSLGITGEPPPEKLLPKDALGWHWSTLRQAWYPYFTENPAAYLMRYPRRRR